MRYILQERQYIFGKTPRSIFTLNICLGVVIYLAVRNRTICRIIHDVKGDGGKRKREWMHFKVEVDTCNTKTNFQASLRPIVGRRDTKGYKIVENNIIYRSSLVINRKIMFLPHPTYIFVWLQKLIYIPT